MILLDPQTADDLVVALADGPDALIGELNRLMLALPGVRTVTWLAAVPEQKITRRIGTSDPKHFPLGASDPIDNGAWSRRIYVDRLPIIGNSPAEMAVYIPETADLEKLGYYSTLCMPIVIAGETRGTVNLLGDAGIFTPDLLSALNTLLPIAALIFVFEDLGTR